MDFRDSDSAVDLPTSSTERSMALVKLFREFGRGELTEFAIGAGASVIAMAMQLVPSYVLMVGIDALLFDTRPFTIPFVPRAWLPTGTESQFVLLVAILGASYVLGSVFGWVNSWAWNHFAQHFQHRIRVATFAALQRREIAFFENTQAGEIMSILNNDVNQLEQFLTDQVNTGIRILVRVGGMGVVMLLINWRLGIIPTVVVPLLGLVSYLFVSRIRPKYREVRASVGALNARLENNLGGIQVIKSYVTEPFEEERVADASREYLDTQWEAITTRILYWPTLRLITAAGYVAIFVIGGWWVIVGSPHPFFRGTMTAGTLVLFLNYSRRFMWPMRQFGQVINTYQYAEAAAERIHALHDREPAVTDSPDAHALEAVEGHISFDDVHFSYDTADDEAPALRGIDFETAPGDYVGIVGPTGAGKTTLIKLLLRFYDVDAGAVRVDGTDVREVTLESLRSHIGYVSQEPYIFHGTVRENVAYGKPDATAEEIRTAAQRAGAHQFIEALPEGYDTTVGERGVKLSGGERQRLSIARAILHDPEILILDEAMSHVDNETEILIQQNLNELTEDRTTFAIAHRLSTVRRADTILVLEDGEIVERGGHDELLERDGLYADLWNFQVGELNSLPADFVERATGRSSDD